MVDNDLELINGKPRSITLDNKKYNFKILKMRQHLKAEYQAQQIDEYNIKSVEDVDKLADLITQYLTTVLEITKKQAEELELEDYKALRKKMSRIDMYDQGFTDREIDALEKKAVTKAARNITSA